MKAISCLTGAFCICILPATGQDVFPGGVAGVKHWYAAEAQPDGAICWANKLAGEACLFRQQPDAASPDGINFNDAIRLSGSSGRFDIPLGSADLSRTSIFTVYQPADTLGEQGVWLLDKDGAGSLVLTTQNMLDVRANRNIPTTAARTNARVLSTYLQYREKDSIAPAVQTLHFGAADFPADRPLRVFRGKIAEILVYDRVLTGQEKQRVETYLALKYGISLSQAYQPTDYLDARGSSIWEAKQSSEYNRHIAGLGRDDRSGLFQKQSSDVSGLVTIGLGALAEKNDANNSTLADGSFLVWSDNGKDPETEAKTQGRPLRLLRQWLATATGAVAEAPAAVHFDANQAENRPSPAETWWLCIDRSATGRFPANATEYIRMDSLTPKGTALFGSVRWDTDRSGRDLFTFAIGPKMMSKVWITAPVCTPATAGVLHIGAEGGRPPYRFALLHAESGARKQWENAVNTVTDITDIAPGNYTLFIVDAANNRFEEQLRVNSADAPEAALAAQYELKPGETLHLDASTGIQPEASAYRWEGPEGLTVYTPDIAITTPGLYRLFIDRDGCTAQQDIRILAFGPDNFKNLSLSPNPVAAGMPFTVEVALRHDAQVTLDIVDPSGRIVARRSFDGNNFYRFTETLNAPPGAFALRFRSDDAVRPLVLIVH